MEADRIKLLFARANEFKEGDLLVGGTADAVARDDARREIESMTIGALAKLVLVEDAVTESIHRSLDRALLREISHVTIRQARDILLGSSSAGWAKRYSDALPSEVMAALAKIMSNDELSAVSRSLFNELPDKARSGGIAIGSERHLGSRIQPNSPGDDEDEILMSVLEGLSFGCGDVIIGLNPSSDDLETIIRTEKLLETIVERLQLPTRYCVLSDMVKQSTARSRTKVDVGFQSLAGTSKGIEGMLGVDVNGLADLARGFDGLYFETGQGSEITNGAAEGVDMVTLESRCYGLARHLRRQAGGKWTIVNDVAGFIGPEVFKTGSQLLRACLEDMVMAKLHGLTMGLDACSTFHMGIDPFELQALTEKIAVMGAPAYLMSVAGKADPMLGYLTTSYREHPRLRNGSGKQMASGMTDRLAGLGALESNGSAMGDPAKTSLLYALYKKAGSDVRSMEALAAEGRKNMAVLREKGCDLGHGFGPGFSDPPEVSARLQTLYQHARNALYAVLEKPVLRDCCPNAVFVSSCSMDREDYLAHPASGERIRDIDTLEKLRSSLNASPQAMIVISDGLNANAVNENLRPVLPGLKWLLKQAGVRVMDADVVVKNGRVRAGYHAASILKPEILLHFIGERPGTGLNQLSVYITYGKTLDGSFRWSPGMDHSVTTAICSIHPKGKTPESAMEDMVKCVRLMMDRRCSGVALGIHSPQTQAKPIR